MNLLNKLKLKLSGKLQGEFKYKGTLVCTYVHPIFRLCFNIEPNFAQEYCSVPIEFSSLINFDSQLTEYTNSVYIYSINGVSLENHIATVSQVTDLASGSDILLVLDGIKFKIRDITLV